MDPQGGDLGFSSAERGIGSGSPGAGSTRANPVSQFYETWWISPQGALYDALRDGAPGHCAWLEEKFGICSRSDARKLGWIRVGWNLTRFYIDGRPDRIEAHRAEIEELLGRHPMVTEVLLEQGSDLDSVLTPEEFLTGR